MYWQGLEVRFSDGQTVAAALLLSGIKDFGSYSALTQARYFCGIGACQSCLVSDGGGIPFEACITLAADDMRLEPFMSSNHD
jgi:aerobic-type carbon monoxide dehydrogenase small subunit (CoxS/CutS family)